MDFGREKETSTDPVLQTTFGSMSLFLFSQKIPSTTLDHATGISNPATIAAFPSEQACRSPIIAWYSRELYHLRAASTDSNSRTMVRMKVVWRAIGGNENSDSVIEDLRLPFH